MFNHKSKIIILYFYQLKNLTYQLHLSDNSHTFSQIHSFFFSPSIYRYKQCHFSHNLIRDSLRQFYFKNKQNFNI